MLVIRYEVVSHEIVLAALNSDPITAYVEAVMVPSNPDRKTLEKMATLRQFGFIANKYVGTGPISIQTNPGPGLHLFQRFDLICASCVGKEGVLSSTILPASTTTALSLPFCGLRGERVHGRNILSM